MLEAGKGSRDSLELEELRARDADHRARAELVTRLGSHAESLQRMLRGRPPSRVHLAQTLLEVAKLSSSALRTARASIWLFDDSQHRLRCTTLLRDGAALSTDDVAIDVTHLPRYLAALSEVSAIAAEDVFSDPRTRELEEYCRANQIGALLDIPIVIPGAVLGVVCHEHVHGARRWQREEIDFASNVGSLVALALETERRSLAEHAALGSEAKYRFLVDSLPVMAYAFDVHTSKLEYLSPHVVQWSGWTPEQWMEVGVGQWIERIDPEDRAAVRARFVPGALRRLPDELTYRVHLPNGQRRFVRDTCQLMRDAQGRLVSVQGVLCDVTEQAEAEAERRELERRQQSMLEHAELHAVMIDAAGLVTFVNDFFCRATGFSPNDVLGRNWFEFTTPPPERPRLQRDLAHGVVHGTVEPRMEAPLHTVSGDKLQVLWTNTLLRDKTGQVHGVLGLGVDMTQRIRLESELLQQTKVESLGRLAAGVAHDFNNLLAVMQAEVELLTKHDPARSPDALRSALQQATELTHSLLIYGRKQPIRVESFSLDELVGQALPLAAAIARDPTRISSALGSEDAHVHLDRTQLRQVILNLVGNAADATRERGGHIRITTHLQHVAPPRDSSTDGLPHRVGAADGGEYTVLTVEDDGCGVSPALLARIFDPFFTTKTDGRGTGLGLALCQSIVQRARGFIEVQSTLGEGTRFRVYLPRVQPVAASKEAPRVQGAIPRILVVDDVAAIRTMLETSLREAGYRVFGADSVAGATQILASQPIDLLLTDGLLLDGSGVALARSARSVQPGLKVILASGSMDAEPGFDAVLLKPFDTAELLAAVRKVLETCR